MNESDYPETTGGRLAVQDAADRCGALAARGGVAVQLELIRAFEDLVLAAQVGQARVLDALDVHEAADFAPHAIRGPWGEMGTVPGPDAVTPHEVAASLDVSVESARMRLAVADTLTTALPAVAAAAEAGQLRWWQARRTVEAAWGLTDTAVATLDSQLARLAREGRLRSRFGPALTRLVIAVDPDLAEHRLSDALTERSVRVRPDDATPGMGVVVASLPAEGAITVAACLDRLADTVLSTPPDGLPAHGRTADARRADALVGLAATVLDAFDAWATTDNQAETGPELVTEAVTGAVRAAVGPALLSGAADPAAGARAPRPARRVRRSGEVHIMVSAETLLGVSDHPGELTGWGPITAAHARRLAQRAGTVWRRILTDPVSGAVLDVGRTRYPATMAITDHVLTRDRRRCTRPGCSHSAGDLDHARPWADGGPTAATNLHAVCRGCHTARHLGWTVEIDPDGAITWQTARGHRSRGPVPDLRPEDRMPPRIGPPGHEHDWVTDLTADLRRAHAAAAATGTGTAAASTEHHRADSPDEPPPPF